MVKNPPAMQETWVRFLGQENPLAEGMAPTPVFLPGKFHWQRRLAGCSPCSSKESDTTEWLTLSHFSHKVIYGLSKWLSSKTNKKQNKKKLPAMLEIQEIQVWSLDWEDPLEEEMTTHSSILARQSHGQRSLPATVHEVAKSQTWLSYWASMHLRSHISLGFMLICLEGNWSNFLKEREKWLCQQS